MCYRAATASRAGDTEAQSSPITTTKPTAEGDTKAFAPDAVGVSPRITALTPRRACLTETAMLTEPRL
jgi:hypothetical protein